MNDFLDRLAEVQVQEPPAEFDRQLHQRVNRALVLQHVFELLVAAVPGAALHFLRGAAAVLGFSLNGAFDEPPASEKPRGEGPQKS